jgi:hypothetical protein
MRSHKALPVAVAVALAACVPQGKYDALATHAYRSTTTAPSAPSARLVVGRKNHYGAKSRRGTEVAATFYSLLETAKLQGVDAAT